MNNLARKAILGFAQLVIGLGLFLLAPAWTLDFWQAWAPITLFNADSASAECSAIIIGPQPNECRFCCWTLRDVTDRAREISESVPLCEPGQL
jgi:hypothetical protein